MDKTAKLLKRAEALNTTFEREAGTGYTPLLAKLSDAVDKMDLAGSKLAREAHRALIKLQAKVKGDNDFQERAKANSNLQYGLDQQWGFVKEAVDKAVEAAGEPGEAYNDLNRWMLKHGLK